MSVSTTLSWAIRHAVPNPTGTCNACERTGLPILPLRAAYAPTPNATSKRPLAGGGDLAAVPMRFDQPRTLREGYLYVLLDKREWQAYQVTPEGALRQFNPFSMPRAAPEPLSERCIHRDHDVPASFINIDTKLFKTAWLAFSSDPWSDSVLNRYLHSFAGEKSPMAVRFYELDLQTARNDPASVGIAMTEQSLQVDQHVLEYATPTIGDFVSAHGFCSRNHRLNALEGFVRIQTQREQLPNGVLALVLPDPVGMVQEINHQRLGWLRERQAYEADPLNNYKFFTSESLKRLRELCKVAADNAIAHSPYAYHSGTAGPPVFGDPARERAEQVEHKAGKLLARLDERYDEAARASWERSFEAHKARLQTQVDRLAELYADQILNNSMFRVAERHDYDAQSAYSVLGYIRTMELCLSGGITEATPKPDSEGNIQPVNGPSARAWEAWVKDGQSIVFKTLLALDKSLMQSLVPTFSNQGELDWNDFGKLYAPITKIITSSDLGDKLIWPNVQDAIASVLAAYNSAVSRLELKVDAGVRNVATRVNSASLLLYSRTYMTQVAVQMKLGEFYTLMCKQIGEDRNRLATAIEKATGKVHKQVRSVLTAGVLSLALSDPKLAEQMVEVVLWVEGNANDLRKRFGDVVKDVTQQAGEVIGDATSRAGEALSELKVLAGTLEPGARKALAGLQLSALQAADLARSGLRGARSAAAIARGTVGSAELLVAVGGTYLLSHGLRKSVEAVDATFGAKHEEAVLAVYSASIGVLGGSIEVVGLTMKGSVEQARKVLRSPVSGIGAMSRIADAGKTLARFGGVLAAVSGFVDALASFRAARRVDASGGGKPEDAYYTAAALFTLSAAFAGYAAFVGSTAILSSAFVLGPVGWAIIFGIAAYLALKHGEESESTPLERWAYYSHFGFAGVHRFPDANTAVSALNAAALGVDASVKLGSDLEYQIVLPQYDSARAGYNWRLSVRRYSGDQNLALGSHPTSASPALEKVISEKRLDYQPETVTPVIRERKITAPDGIETCVLIIDGNIKLKRDHDIDEVRLSLEYFPNIQDLEVVASVEVLEVK
ncbi:T6SS effector BTH_I2691 family protein [Achromobacter insolitus]|uniref:T6SS effector BTH_I2691 family protein n=1 Tax=Achromobacter insolitus TaxID=217204 RepID=UPI00174B2C58|nr:T6SS effector BTH_I2691 family protein [Achromobacter insolitus]